MLLRYGVVLAGEAFPAEFGTILFNVNPDADIFAFAFGISLAAGLPFGLAPTLESSRAAVSAARGSTMPARSRRIQDLLVAAQVALSLVLMIAGSMFVRSAVNSQDIDLGANSSTLETMLSQSPPFLASSMAAAIASTVGLFGLLLAAMGIYGTTSYLVVLRTREVGIRMAIGAPGSAVLFCARVSGRSPAEW